MKTMKTLMIFVTITLLVMVAGNLYFEFAVNREMPTAFSYPLTVVMIAIVGFYMVYLIKTIINLLNLKK